MLVKANVNQMFLIVQAEHVQFGQKQQQKTRYVAA
jgi:pantothenate synthetase